MALTRATDKIIANADGNLNLSGIVTASSFSGPLVPSGDLNVGSNIKLGTASGIVTATSFSGDGSNLTSLPAGLGTALSSTQTSPLNKLYYTNEILSIGATVTVDHPATGTGAYTQYADIRLDEGADLIIEDGDDVIPDILGLGTDGGGLGAGGSGRIRVDSITNKNANGAPNFTNGVTGTAATFTNSSTIAGIVTLTSGGVDTVGVVTATSFKGDGSQLSNITSTTINNNADNRVITGSGTANTLEGEATFTYNSGTMFLSNSGGDAYIKLSRNASVSDGTAIGTIDFCNNTGNTTNARVAAYASGGSNVGGHLYFETRDPSNSTLTEKLRITSSGVLQIKEPAGGAADGASMNFIFGNNNSTDVVSSIIFSNNVGEVSRIQGETRNGNTNGMITFHSDISGTSAERMRVNHDGAFCFGNDSARPAEFSQPDGFSIRFDDKGQFQNTVSSTTGGLMNRKGSDGDILSFRKAGTDVGHIGVNGSTMYLNFGSTVSADHQLDDYEEGSYTPNVQTDNGVNAGLAVGQGYYVKVGSIVTVHLKIETNSHNSVNTTGQYKVSLPYTSLAAGDTQGTLMCSIWSIGSSNISWMGGQVHNNNAWTHIAYHNGSNNNTNNLTPQLASNQLQFRGTVVYRSNV